MSEVSTLSLEDLEALRKEVAGEIRKQREAAKRADRLPVRLAEKDGVQALLIQPPGRRGAPTRITREVAEVVLSDEWAEVAAAFARGEELDPTLFEQPEEEAAEESSDED